MKKGLYGLFLLFVIMLLTGCFDKEYVNDTVVCTKSSTSKYSVTVQNFELVVADGKLTKATNVMSIDYLDEYSKKFDADVLREELNERLKKYGEINISVNEKGARIVVDFTIENLEKYFGYTIKDSGTDSKFVNKVIKSLEKDDFKC